MDWQPSPYSTANGHATANAAGPSCSRTALFARGLFLPFGVEPGDILSGAGVDALPLLVVLGEVLRVVLGEVFLGDLALVDGLLAVRARFSCSYRKCL